MPQSTFEYSSNLEGRADIGALCKRILREGVATGLFEAGAVRVRAIRCEHYAIADDLKANAFIDMSLRVGAGRSAEIASAPATPASPRSPTNCGRCSKRRISRCRSKFARSIRS